MGNNYKETYRPDDNGSIQPGTYRTPDDRRNYVAFPDATSEELVCLDGEFTQDELVFFVECMKRQSGPELNSFDVLFMDGHSRRCAAINASVAKVVAAHLRLIEGSCSHKELRVIEVRLSSTNNDEGFDPLDYCPGGIDAG